MPADRHQDAPPARPTRGGAGATLVALRDGDRLTYRLDGDRVQRSRIACELAVAGWGDLGRAVHRAARGGGTLLVEGTIPGARAAIEAAARAAGVELAHAEGDWEEGWAGRRT